MRYFRFIAGGFSLSLSCGASASDHDHFPRCERCVGSTLPSGRWWIVLFFVQLLRGRFLGADLGERSACKRIRLLPIVLASLGAPRSVLPYRALQKSSLIHSMRDRHLTFGDAIDQFRGAGHDPPAAGRFPAEDASPVCSISLKRIHAGKRGSQAQVARLCW